MLTVAQHATLDLACRGLGQPVYELDLPWVLVRCRDTLYVFLNLLGQEIAPKDSWAQNDECLHDLAAFDVRTADDRAFLHRHMLYDRILDLDRSDAIASGIDHIIGAAEIEDISILIDFDDVATVDPLVAVAAYDRGLAQFRIFPVADHGLRIWQPDHQTSGLPHHRRPVFRI